MASRSVGLPVELAQAPLRTVRAHDVQAYAQPRAQLARLARIGLVHRLSDGYFTVVPQNRVGTSWKPSLEGAAAGIAAADFGPGQYALMGFSAARIHGAEPRALSVAYIAAPRRRAPLQLKDRDAILRFLPRNLDILRLEMATTDLGDCLVTTPEQTALDLIHLHWNDIDLKHETMNVVGQLLRRSNDPVELEEIAREQRLRRALDRLQKARRPNVGHG